jgi:hypothetical protein
MTDIAINDPVWIKEAPCSSELIERQSEATGESVGVVVNVWKSDGKAFADVLFATYGGMITGIPVEDLEPVVAKPKGFLSRVFGTFLGG